MNSLKTFIAFGLALALGLFYWFYEVKGGSARENAKLDAKRIFAFTQKEPLAELAWHSPDSGYVRLVQKSGAWFQLSPSASAVDAGELAALSEQVKAFVIEEAVDEAPVDYAPFGLSPAASVFTARGLSGSARTLHIGKNNPTGQYAYARIEGEKPIFLIGSYYRRSLMKSPKDLKPKPTPTPVPTAKPSASAAAAGQAMPLTRPAASK